MAQPKARNRSALSSLSARIQRRERPETIAPPADHDDDDCPVCVAMRSGRQLTVEELSYLMLNPEPLYLAKLARRALETVTLGPGETTEFMANGSLRPDGTYSDTRFVVDAIGNVYRERDGTRTFIIATRV
jgi:hypothetical protein